MAATGQVALSPGDEVVVDFPVLSPGRLHAAAVVHLADGTDGHDLAGLSVSEVPDEAYAVRVVAADDVSGHRVQAFGTTATRPDGIWSEGVLRRPIADGVFQIEDERDYGVPIQPGFSGSPLIDLELGAVIGMVTGVESKPERRVAYALPGAALHEGCPQLAHPAAQRSPFRSLEPFQQANAGCFYGRDGYAKQVAGRLGTDGLCLVTGPSGSGKSSLAQAGVLPLLADAGREAMVFRPAAGSSPWQSFAASLIGYLHDGPAQMAEIDELAGRLREQGVEDALNRVLVGQDLRSFTIVADQFDEGLARDADASADLLAALLDAHDSHRREPRIGLLITVTSDALDDLLSDRRLGHRLSGRVIALAEPGSADLRAIIESPLSAAGTPVYEAGLVDVLLQDVAGERNPLPVLEFTLTLLWERQCRGVLTHETYRDLGGVAGALTCYAEQVCEPYLASDSRTAGLRWVLGQLISPVEPDRVVRRVVPIEQLGPAAGLARELAVSRLVTLGTVAGQQATVELAHEALIRHWPRLRDWVELDRAFRAWQDDLDRQSERWHSRPEKALLLRGSMLRDARLHCRQSAGALTRRQRAFVNASTRYQRRRRYRTCVISVLIVGLMASAAELTGGFVRQRDSQNASNAAQALLAQQQQFIINRPMQSLATAVRAFRTDDTLSTRDALHSWADDLGFATAILPGSFRYAGSVQPINADASGIVMIDPKGHLVAWNLSGRHPSEVVIPAPPGAAAVAWLGSSKLITSYSGGSSIIWDARTGQIVQRLPFGGDFLAADATGRLVAYGESGQRVLRVADLAHPQAPPRVIPLPRPVSTGSQSLPGQITVTDVLLNGTLIAGLPGGQEEAIGSGGSRALQFTDGDPGMQILDGGGHDQAVTGCITTSSHTTLQLRSLRTGHLLAQYSQYQGIGTQDCTDVNGTFTPDGRYMAVTDSAGPSVSYSTTTYAGPVGGSLQSFPTPPGYAAIRTAIEPNGTQRIVLWGMDSMLVLEVPKRSPLQIAQQDASASQMSGKYLLLGFRDGRAEAWDTTSGRMAGSAAVLPSRDGNSVAFDADDYGDVVATSGGSPAVIRLWRVPDLAPLGQIRLPPTPRGYFASGVDVEFSADRLVLIQWQTRQPQESDELQAGRAEVSFWNIGTGRQILKPVTVGSSNAQANQDSAAGFLIPSPDGTELIQDDNGTIRKIVLSGGAAVPDPGFTDADSGTSLSAQPAVDRSGRFLALAHGNVAEVWDLNSGRLAARLTSPQGSEITAISFQGTSTSLEAGISVTQSGNVDLVQAWDWNPYFGIPAWFGLKLMNVTNIDEPSTAFLDEIDADGSGYEAGSLDPQAWLAGICHAWYPNPLDESAAGLPANAWPGAICPGR